MDSIFRLACLPSRSCIFFFFHNIYWMSQLPVSLLMMCLPMRVRTVSTLTTTPPQRQTEPSTENTGRPTDWRTCSLWHLLAYRSNSSSKSQLWRFHLYPLKSLLGREKCNIICVKSNNTEKVRIRLLSQLIQSPTPSRNYKMDHEYPK